VALATATVAGSPEFALRDWIYLIVLLFTLVIAGIASAAETALTSVNRIRIRNLADEGDKRAQRIERLLHQPHLFITTILVVNNLSIIIASTLATLIAVDVNVSFAEVLSTILLALVVLLFCEITPKTAAVQAPEHWSRWLVGPVDALMRFLLPLIIVLTYISNGLIRLFGGKPGAKTPFVTEDELRLMVEVSEEEGVLEEEEREMIDNVFELSDTTVREVMVPRIDMVAVEADVPVEEATRVVLQGGQSRVPVYDDSVDDIIGVLYAKDLLRVLATGQKPPSVRGLVRPAYFVPESKRLDDLLRELKDQRNHMAIVFDEYGSVSGLVTIEDLVEEIIGDIKDEYDIEEQLFERVSETEFIIDAKLPVDEFDELVGRELPEGDYDTLGGFVTVQLDKIPTIGDVVTYEDLTITVLDTKGRRVTKVKVVRHVPDESGPSREAEAGTLSAPREDQTRPADSGAPAQAPLQSRAQPQAPGGGSRRNGAPLPAEPLGPRAPSAPIEPAATTDSGSTLPSMPDDVTPLSPGNVVNPTNYAGGQQVQAAHQPRRHGPQPPSSYPQRPRRR
jgi:CBS domain containing-hemolysin-like protein